MKKMLAIVFAVVMLLVVVPMSVFAEEPAISWTYEEETGELVISGNGAMDNYSATAPAPWDEYRTEIKKISVESGVTTIGNDTFIGCSNLTEVSLPDGLTKIGDSAFRDCSSLTDIELPDTVKSLGHYAFYGCIGFEEFWLGDGVKTIGNHAFRKCTNLRIITFSDSITTVNKNAFNECESLDFVIYKGTKDQWSAVTISEGNDIIKSAMLRCGEIIKYDADGNGEINSTDALCCLQHAVGKVNYVGDWADSMDINSDGKINSYDALKILQYSVNAD